VTDAAARVLAGLERDLAEVVGEEEGSPESGDQRFTDVGNARRLVLAHGHRFRYVNAWAQWLVWDGRRFRRDAKGEVVEAAKAVAGSLWARVPGADDVDRKALARWAAQSESAQRIEAMIKLARTEPGIAVEPDELDAHPWLLNVANGTVDLRTGELRPHRRQDLLTKLAPVDHDPGATCPTWTAFLARIMPDDDVRAFLQEVVGYALTGVTTEQILVFCFGQGANGKSTLTETLQAMVGDYGRQAEPGLLLARQDVHPTGVADLQGARLVVATEVEEGRRLGEATVKQLTGGDRIKARYMRADFFEFTPTHKLFLHGNHRPIVRGTDHAIWRRLRLIPFTVTIPREEQDKHLVSRLTHELPGILMWALQGCLRWQQHGLSQPAAVLAATSDYRSEMDVLGAFLEECCVVADRAYVSSANLYRAYQSWLDDNGERSVSQRSLGVALTERGFDRRKHGPDRRWHWFGIGLLEPMNPPDPESGITPRARARVGETGDTGSQGFKGSSEPRLPYSEGS
jgi:putative DNA primase/helicase